MFLYFKLKLLCSFLFLLHPPEGMFKLMHVCLYACLFVLMFCNKEEIVQISCMYVCFVCFIVFVFPFVLFVCCCCFNFWGKFLFPALLLPFCIHYFFPSTSFKGKNILGMLEFLPTQSPSLPPPPKKINWHLKQAPI